jgi:hypothetical protein
MPPGPIYVPGTDRSARKYTWHVFSADLEVRPVHPTITVSQAILGPAWPPCGENAAYWNALKAVLMMPSDGNSRTAWQRNYRL